jgi:hypothetical protein
VGKPGSSVLAPVIMQPVWCVYSPVSSAAREGVQSLAAV